MSLLTQIRIQNFKCYRERQEFNLAQGNFFIGANNAGKSAVLKALHCFFDSQQFSWDLINKTELRSKGAGYNRSVIEVTFDLNRIATKSLRDRLAATHGSILAVRKIFTYREKTSSIHIEYVIKGETYDEDDLPADEASFLSKVSVSYLHPQEAKDLLDRAQAKLRSRLISNWGRNAQLAVLLRDLQENWSDLRSRANGYLSNGLTESLQGIWPGCLTKVDLPEKIEDIIGVSDISFRGSPSEPEVSLTSQGTGAQSTILYQTHFLLDSDKTLHRGFYYPVWLVEEPESFLHADIISKLGQLLCSDSWLDNIQMLVSTHSPILLATTKQNEDRIKWFVLDQHQLSSGKVASDWSSEEVRGIGRLMGDANFEVYFAAADNETPIIIEDSRAATANVLRDAGIAVTKALNGASDLRRYFDVLRSMKIADRPVFLLVDNDDGFKNFASAMGEGTLVRKTAHDFQLYAFDNNINLVVFPQGWAVEDLFTEFDPLLESCANKIFNADHTKAVTDVDIPANLTRAHTSIRNKSATGLDEAKNMIRGNQDVKDIFWGKVESDGLKINGEIAEEISSLIT